MVFTSLFGGMGVLLLLASLSFAFCPPEMVWAGPLCVDRFEASVWSQKPDRTGLPHGTQYGVTGDDYPCSDNGNDCSKHQPGAIYAASVPGVTPSAHITWFQAQQACCNVGKRLLRNDEWQAAAAGTPDDAASCNTSLPQFVTSLWASVRLAAMSPGR